MKQARIPIPTEKITEFCRRNHIRHLGLFGSVLRDDFRPDSDVDVLVEFEPGTRVSLFALHRRQEELAALMGHAVDLVPRADLKPVIRESVLASEQIIHVA